jgi:hypothetical protein
MRRDQDNLLQLDGDIEKEGRRKMLTSSKRETKKVEGVFCKWSVNGSFKITPLAMT